MAPHLKPVVVSVVPETSSDGELVGGDLGGGLRNVVQLLQARWSRAIRAS